MNFVYQGFDAMGRAASGSVEAPAKADACEVLRRQGVFVTSVEEGAPPAGASSRVGAQRRVKLKDLALFFRQVSILVSTHTPLVQALECAERQTAPGDWRTTVGELRRRVEEGESLSEAMSAYPQCFDAVCRSMTAAGESGGMLDSMLKGLSTLTRQQMTLRKSVIGAMAYPVILITVSVAVVTVMMVFVLPQFANLFQTLQTPLPPSTKFLMSIGETVRGYWWIILPLVIAIGGGATMWLRSAAGRLAIDHGLVKAPKLGPIMRSFAIARISRLLGVLLQAKITLLDALRLTRAATANACYNDLLRRAEDAVSRGQTLASVLSDPALVIPSVSEAVASGERTGQIGAVLVQVAEYLDEDNDQVVKTISSLIEPLILSVLGVVVGFVAISMFLPLFDLTAAGGGGGGGGAPP